MIYGIGTDITEISRLGESIEKFGNTFLRRVYTEPELALAETRGKRKLEFLAGRWAAKEAAAKALGSGFGEKASPVDFEILADEHDAPVLKTVKWPELRWQVSISHDGGLALAFVIAETK